MIHRAFSRATCNSISFMRDTYCSSIAIFIIQKGLNKKFRHKRASPSFISHLCGRETLISRGKLLTHVDSEKCASNNFIISPQQYKISSSYAFNYGYSEN